MARTRCDMKTMSPFDAYLMRINPALVKSGAPVHIKAPMMAYALSDDVRKHAYWKVWLRRDKCETEFAKSGVLLDHAIHPVTLTMPLYMFEEYMRQPDTHFFDDYMAWVNVESSILQEYTERSIELGKQNKLCYGRMLVTNVADGHAYYLVTKATRAHVYFEHLRFGDAYHDAVISSFDGKMPRAQFERMLSVPRLMDIV